MQNGVIWRIAFDHLADRLLEGALHHEGRFHHAGQRAFYSSPTPEFAKHAVAAFCKPSDPPRSLFALDLTGATLLDLRNAKVCADLGIEPETPSIPWQPQRAKGQAAATWLASDAVRASGADGLIFGSRSVSARWHLVLFSWNELGHAHLRLRPGSRTALDMSAPVS